MATQLTEEQIEEIKERAKKEQSMPRDMLTDKDYEDKIKKLGEDEGYRLDEDYQALKNNIFEKTYSPRTGKIYTYADTQNLTPKQFYEDLISAGHGLTPAKDAMNKIADEEMKSVVGLVPGLITKAEANLIPERILNQYTYGMAETTGATLAYKNIKGALGTADTLLKAYQGDKDAIKEIKNTSNNPSLSGFLYGNNRIGNMIEQKGQEAINNKVNRLNMVDSGSGTTIARGAGNIVGNILTLAGGSAFGTIAGPALGLSTKVGSTAGVIGAGALGSGARTATYTNDPIDIIGDTIKGGVQTGAFVGTTGLLGNVLPPAKGIVGNLGRNVALGSAGGYVSTTAGKEVDIGKKIAKGQSVTLSDIADMYASPEHATSTLASGIGYGVQGLLKDVGNKIETASNNPTKVAKEEAYKILGLKSNATEKEILSATKNLIKQYHPDTGGSGASTQKLNDVLKARDYLLENITSPSLLSKIKNAFSEFTGKFRTGNTSSAKTDTTITNPYLPATASQLATPNTPAVTNNVPVQPVTPTNTMAGISNAVATKNPNAPTADLTTAKISPERLDAYLKEWTNSKMPNYSQAYLTRMTPDEFLSLTATDSDMKHIKNDNASRAEHGWTLDKVKYDPEETTEPQAIKLTVDFDTGEVIGHEGRHRMQALKDNGIKNVDVVIKPYAYSKNFDRSNPQKYIDKITVTQQYGVKPATVLLKDLDVISPSNLDYIKQKYLDTTGDDKTIRYSQNPGYKQIYVIKPVSKETNPDWDKNIVVYDDKDNEIKLSDYKDVIENSMSMKEAEEMIKRAYIMDRDKSRESHALKHGIKNFKQYVNEYAEKLVADDVLRQGLLVEKYVNPIKEFAKEPRLIEGVIRAYKNKALKGSLPTKKFGKVDTSKSVKSNRELTPEEKYASATRFYETGNPTAKDKNFNRGDSYITMLATKKLSGSFITKSIIEARRDFIIQAHNKDWLKEQKITAKEAYELSNEWAGYKKSNFELSNKLNQGVAPENRWTGLENSTILSKGVFDKEDLKTLGVKFYGEENEDLVTYLVNTMLAIDTHQRWGGLRVNSMTKFFNGSTGAEYEHATDEITVYKNGQNSVSHEMGHRLDYIWGNQIFNRGKSGRTTHPPLTNRVTDETLQKVLYTEEERDFVRHFYAFMDDIGKNTTFKSNYTIDEGETFARFVAKFVEWTFKKANNPIGEKDWGWYKDTFTEKQFKEFVKILQEESALTMKNEAYMSSQEAKNLAIVKWQLGEFGNRSDAFKKLVEDSYKNNISNREGFVNDVLSNKTKFATEKFEKEFMEKLSDEEHFRFLLGKVYDDLQDRSAKYDKLGKYDYGQALWDAFENETYQNVSQQAKVWNKNPKEPKLEKSLNKNLTVEKQKKEIEKLEKANDKLKEKLAKEKEKGKQTVFKKNEEKKKAVKAEREKGKEKLGAFKKKADERMKEAKANTKATTTDKKMRLANNKLEKSLQNIYDKPMSKELETALTQLQKSTRGSIKLIDNVKNKMPSSYSHFADDVKEIVDTIYTGANKMTDERRKNLERKAEAIQKFIKEHPEYPVSQRALDLLKEPTKKNIADLNSADLVSMAEDVAEIGIAIRDMFSFVRSNQNAVELRQKAIDFAKERRATGKTRSNDNLPDNALAYKVLEFGRGELDKRSTLKNMVLRLAGGNPDSPMSFISDTLAEAYSRENINTERMLSVFDRFVRIRKFGNVRTIQNDLNDIWNHKNEVKTVLKTMDGKDYRPSLADAISFVIGVRDPQFAGHTVGVLTDRFKKHKFKASKPLNKNEKAKTPTQISGYKTFKKEPIFTDGGIARFGNRVDQKYGSQGTALKRGVNIKITPEDYKKLLEEVQQIPHFEELVDAYRELSGITAQLTNEAYEAINGMGLEIRDQYFPVVTDPATRVRQRISDDLTKAHGFDASTTLLNSSIVKPVVEGANNQILIYPIDEVIRKLISDTAKYSAYATALYDINTFLSGRAENGPTLIELINDIDPNFISNYNKITDAIIGDSKHPNVSKIASRYTSAILKGNIWIAFKQAGSYFTTAKYFDYPFRSLLAGAFAKKNIANKLRDWYKEQGVDLSKLNTDQVLRYFWSENVDAEIATRARGWNTATRDQLLKHLGILQHINTLDFYKGVDYSTVRAIAYAMIFDTILSGKFDGSDKYFAELHNRFLTANIETQPNTSAITRTPIQTSGNALDRALAYMGDPRLKTLNMLMEARLENKYYRKNGSKEEKQRNRRNFARAVVGTVGSLAFLTTIARTKKKIEGKDDEKGFAGFLKDLIGNGIALSVGIEQFTGRLMDEYSFDVELPDTQALNILLNTYDDFTKFIDNVKKEKTNKIASSLSKVIGDISKFVGIPYQNLKTLYDEMLSVTGSELYYENKIEADDNAYKKYKKYEDKIDDTKEFYTLYKATREKAVTDKYGKYTDANVKKAIRENGGDIAKYFGILKRGS